MADTYTIEFPNFELAVIASEQAAFQAGKSSLKFEVPWIDMATKAIRSNPTSKNVRDVIKVLLQELNSRWLPQSGEDIVIEIINTQPDIGEMTAKELLELTLASIQPGSRIFFRPSWLYKKVPMINPDILRPYLLNHPDLLAAILSGAGFVDGCRVHKVAEMIGDNYPEEALKSRPLTGTDHFSQELLMERASNWCRHLIDAYNDIEFSQKQLPYAGIMAWTHFLRKKAFTYNKKMSEFLAEGLAEVINLPWRGSGRSKSVYMVAALLHVRALASMGQEGVKDLFSVYSGLEKESSKGKLRGVIEHVISGEDNDKIVLSPSFVSSRTHRYSTNLRTWNPIEPSALEAIKDELDAAAKNLVDMLVAIYGDNNKKNKKMNPKKATLLKVRKALNLCLHALQDDGDDRKYSEHIALREAFCALADLQNLLRASSK